MLSFSKKIKLLYSVKFILRERKGCLQLTLISEIQPNHILSYELSRVQCSHDRFRGLTILTNNNFKYQAISMKTSRFLKWGNSVHSDITELKQKVCMFFKIPNKLTNTKTSHVKMYFTPHAIKPLGEFLAFLYLIWFKEVMLFPRIDSIGIAFLSSECLL